MRLGGFMLKKTVLCGFLLTFSMAIQAASLKDLIDAIKDLTADVEALNALGQKFYKLAEEDQQYLLKLAHLPEQLTELNGNIAQALPTIEKCTIILSASILCAVTICSMPRIVKYCMRRRERNRPLLEDEFVVNR